MWHRLCLELSLAPNSYLHSCRLCRFLVGLPNCCPSRIWCLFGGARKNDCCLRLLLWHLIFPRHPRAPKNQHCRLPNDLCSVRFLAVPSSCCPSRIWCRFGGARKHESCLRLLLWPRSGWFATAGLRQAEHQNCCFQRCCRLRVQTGHLWCFGAERPLVWCCPNRLHPLSGW